MQQGLAFWFKANLTNPYNWYHGEISVPIAVGRACVLVDAATTLDMQPLPEPLRSGCAATMLQADWDKNPPGMTNVTGANLVWMGTARVYRGLLLDNGTEVEVATSRIFGQLYTTSKHAAGCKEDGSFFQHDHGQTTGGVLVGPYGQLYSGGYGADFSEFMIEWALLTNNTAFSPSEKLWELFGTLLIAQDAMIVRTDIIQS